MCEYTFYIYMICVAVIYAATLKGLLKLSQMRGQNSYTDRCRRCALLGDTHTHARSDYRQLNVPEISQVHMASIFNAN